MRNETRSATVRPAPGRVLLALAALLMVPALPASADPPQGAPPAGGADSTATVGAADSVANAAAASSAPLLVVRSRRVRLIGKSDNVVRSGPGSGFAIVGLYPRDRSFTVIAKSGEWYNVRLSDTETGWVHASLCEELDDLSGLEFRPNPKLYTRTGTYVLSGYAGAYAFDRKSNSLVLGGRVAYYVFSRLQAEAGVSWTHVRRGQEVVESLFGLTLEAEDFHMLFYHLNLTWELLPGRQMVPYVSGGVGSTIMLGRAEPSFNLGAGTRLFLSKRSAVRWEVRDFRFSSGSDAARLTNNNIEFTLGSEYLF
jgi:outer membrane beta-barrel protein